VRILAAYVFGILFAIAVGMIAAQWIVSLMDQGKNAI